MKSTDDVEPQGPFCTLGLRYHRNPAYRYAVQINFPGYEKRENFWQTWKLYKTMQDALNALRDLQGFSFKRIVHVYYTNDGQHGRKPWN